MVKSQGEREQTRRAFLRGLAGIGAALAGVGALAGCAPAPPASSPSRVYRVGVLRVAGALGVMSHFWARLEELGYVEGQKLMKVDRSDVESSRDGESALELARLPVDVIVAGPPPAIRAALDASTSIPIVMMGPGADPVASGFVASIARPGGNVTGIVGGPGLELEQKRLQLLIEAAPSVSKVAVLGSASAAEELLRAAARSLGVGLVFESVETRDFDAAFENAVAEGADAILQRSTAVSSGVERDRIINLAERYRLPACYALANSVRAGGLIAYEARGSEIARRAADYVDRILRGASPADLPVEFPTRYDLVVNMRAARAIGLTFPPSFMAQVDEVIE